MFSFENPLHAINDANNALTEAGIEVVMYQYPTRKNKLVVDTTKHDKDVVLDLLKWLEDKGYLTHIVYDEDEDFDGNIVHFEREERLNADEVLAEYEKESRNEK